MRLEYLASAALFDETEAYRYWLERRWTPGPRALWIGLNPSKAGADLDDHTIRKEVGFSRRWGMGGLTKVNLGALVCTDPRLIDTRRWIGADNDSAIGSQAARWHPGDLVVAAWGDVPSWAWDRERAVLELLRNFDIVCIGKTRRGAPLHSSRPGYTAQPVLYRAGAQGRAALGR